MATPFKTVSVVLLALLSFHSLAQSPDKSQRQTNAAAVNTLKSFSLLPMRFEMNQGQTDTQVQFLVRGAGHALFLAPDEAVLTLRGPAGRAPSREMPASLPGGTG